VPHFRKAFSRGETNKINILRLFSPADIFPCFTSMTKCCQADVPTLQKVNLLINSIQLIQQATENVIVNSEQRITFFPCQFVRTIFSNKQKE